MKIIYTDGQDKDFIFLCHLLDDYLNEIVGGRKQRLQYEPYNTLANIHDVILVYTSENIPIGCAAFKEYAPGTAEIKRVYLKPEYRGRKIGLMLLNNLEHKAKEKGYHKLILETGAPLTSALKLYQKMGYHAISNYGPYENMKESICLAKDI